MANTKIAQRQIAGGLDGWIPAEQTWTYASATTITVPSGAASRYQKGDKIKLTQTTVKYFYVIGVADTVLTVTGGTDYTVANAAITLPFFSKIENPQGFPSYFNYVPIITAHTGTITTKSGTGRFIVRGGVCDVSITLSITDNGTGSVAVLASIPLQANCSATVQFALNGRETNAIGSILQAQLTTAYNTSMFIRDGANAYPGGNGTILNIQGWYVYV